MTLLPVALALLQAFVTPGYSFGAQPEAVSGVSTDVAAASITTANTAPSEPTTDSVQLAAFPDNSDDGTLVDGERATRVLFVEPSPNFELDQESSSRAEEIAPASVILSPESAAKRRADQRQKRIWLALS